ncbi:BTB/POZ domain-containing protein At1g01640-like isoform X2 [Amborella trichopoda]|uniref:BTB/POZ domain-containing protein At1g01640-like isoform X2 n=1 Tax=Amborella trichopoda TaxID=13333 RepID=UPI0009BCEF03|nr:BTB/POZ domain-containing protein At1g01640-like isoform X2 [Amborella trichopoda]|eukprot:XP_020521676.1 BTB/POZ domain-containing protein At1g01640-like isoform X2 [Amborella trichopoda]
MLAYRLSSLSVLGSMMVRKRLFTLWKGFRRDCNNHICWCHRRSVYSLPNWEWGSSDSDQGIRIWGLGQLRALSLVFNKVKRTLDLVNDQLVKVKESNDGSNERLGFLEELKFGIENGTHADIALKPQDGPAALAHKAVLSSRSPIFKAMLEIDECKAVPKETISIPGMNSQELKAFLEFLYRPDEEFSRHAHALMIAADNFSIHFLQKQCVHQIVQTLDSSNALKVLELSEKCSNVTLKEIALKTIVMYQDEIFFSEKHVKFAHSNTQLSVAITRARIQGS